MRVRRSELCGYYRTLARRLPDASGEKAKYLKAIRGGVEEFLAEHPDAGLLEIYREIGTVDELCEVYKDHLSPEQLARSMKRTRFLCGLAAVIAVMAVICCVAVVWWLQNHEVKEFEVDYTETLEDHTKIVVQPD